MPNITKQVVETVELKSKIFVKTIMVGYERKISPSNYDPKLPYEAAGEPVTIWADLIDPVLLEDIDPYFDAMQEKVKTRVNGFLGDIIKTLTEKGRTPKLELNAVFGAFKSAQTDNPDQETLVERWQAFLNDIASYSQEQFT